jgi:hypothetical protein
VRNWQRRLVYLVCAVVVVALGLASRRYAAHLPVFISEYAGDTLWALMVYLGISILVPGSRVSVRAGIALAFAFAIEISQFYHAPWIDSLRRTTLGGLVLGFGFLWTDLICYATGVFIGVLVDSLVVSKARARSGSSSTETA